MRTWVSAGMRSRTSSTKRSSGGGMFALAAGTSGLAGSTSFTRDGSG
jgi:hypothetical protein